MASAACPAKASFQGAKLPRFMELLPVHEHKGGASALVVACVDFSLLPRNMMLGK